LRVVAISIEFFVVSERQQIECHRRGRRLLPSFRATFNLNELLPAQAIARITDASAAHQAQSPLSTARLTLARKSWRRSASLDRILP
jgi:hypothetical protein